MSDHFLFCSLPFYFQLRARMSCNSTVTIDFVPEAVWIASENYIVAVWRKAQFVLWSVPIVKCYLGAWCHILYLQRNHQSKTPIDIWNYFAVPLRCYRWYEGKLGRARGGIVLFGAKIKWTISDLKSEVKRHKITYHLYLQKGGIDRGRIRFSEVQKIAMSSNVSDSQWTSNI